MTIASIVHGKPHRLISVAPDESLQYAAEILARERIGALLVLKPNGDIAGIISERDIVRAIGV
jgi:CBS domain-containing protein